MRQEYDKRFKGMQYPDVIQIVKFYMNFLYCDGLITSLKKSPEAVSQLTLLINCKERRVFNQSFIPQCFPLSSNHSVRKRVLIQPLFDSLRQSLYHVIVL